ncbi:MAG TPA: 50S ribosomal protein L25, partial [Pirellulales bacterium]
MIMSETLNVQKRTVLGKRPVARLRAEGIVPAVLYGHGEENLSLQLPESDVVAAVKAGNRVVTLQGDISETAFIKELQWDVF